MRAIIRPRPRGGYTLIELLVVITIIVTLAALTALFIPNFQEGETVRRGVDALQSWLLTAKQQARRDGLPTGVRLTVDSNRCTQLQFIQQREDFAAGQYTGRAGGQEYVGQFANVNMTDAEAFPVAPDDYLEIFGGGVVHRITAVTANTLTVVNNGYPLPDLSASPPASNAPTNYRIIPAPRLLAGEQPLNLPEPVIIDLGSSNLLSLTDKALSRNVPVRGTGAGATYDILFAPSGAVIGQGTTSGTIILWVRDGSADISASLLNGRPVLVAIQPRTGFIAAYPASSPSGDPFAFVRDAKGTGL